jgi:hypothetical protein
MKVSMMDWEFGKGVSKSVPTVPRQTHILHETGQVFVYLAPKDETGAFIPGQDVVVELPPEAYAFLASAPVSQPLLGALMSLGKGTFSGKELDFSSIEVVEWEAKVGPLDIDPL